MIYRNDQVSDSEIEKILEVARRCLVIEGDFVEMGCYKGETSILLARMLAENGKEKKGVGATAATKTLWLYDSFEGLPEKAAEDASTLGENFRKGELAATKRELKERFLRANLKLPKITKAWFSDLTPKDLPGKIAFAFLDGDFYESIRDSLRLVAPKMTAGGMVVVHDYWNEALPGVARAVKEFLRSVATKGRKWELVGL